MIARALTITNAHNSRPQPEPKIRNSVDENITNACVPPDLDPLDKRIRVRRYIVHSDLKQFKLLTDQNFCILATQFNVLLSLSLGTFKVVPFLFQYAIGRHDISHCLLFLEFKHEL